MRRQHIEKTILDISIRVYNAPDIPRGTSGDMAGREADNTANTSRAARHYTSWPDLRDTFEAVGSERRGCVPTSTFGGLLKKDA